MPRERGDISRLHRHGRSQLVLKREIPAHRIRGYVIKLDSTQSQAAGVDQKWVQWSTRKTSLQRRTTRGSRRGTASKVVDGVAGIRIEKREIKLERVVFANVGRETAVLESVIEDAKASANNELRRNLVGKAYTRRKIGFLRVP